MTKLETVISLVCERAPLQKKQIDKMVKVMTEEERTSAERTLTFFTGKLQYSLEDVAKAYLWFIDTFMEAQMDFSRTGKYPHSTFAEIEDYYKDAQMMKNYVISLAITLYLFPQHITVNRFYKNSILNQSSKMPLPCYYLEVGPGHGHLFVTAMENSNYDSYMAVDISQSSVDMTVAYAEYCLPNKTNWVVERKDFFDFDSVKKFDAIVMGEVLEHVEQPRKFLTKIRDLANDNAFIYITTAINAPCFDHIYYFGAVGEVEQMFIECGLRVKDKVYGIAGGADFDKAVKKKYSIVPAYVLEKV
jgi:ubiquinone/menaquinone biosynthesis C-methylase UbiE